VRWIRFYLPQKSLFFKIVQRWTWLNAVVWFSSDQFHCLRFCSKKIYFLDCHIFGNRLLEFACLIHSLQQCFPTFLSLRHPTEKKISAPIGEPIAIWLLNLMTFWKCIFNDFLAAPLSIVNGTLACRGPPVGNRCFTAFKKIISVLTNRRSLSIYVCGCFTYCRFR